MVTLLRSMIKLYQWIISPLLPSACRFTPSCSHYAYEALATHGLFRGSLLALRRILRCHPWGGCGCDPIPPYKNPTRQHDCDV